MDYHHKSLCLFFAFLACFLVSSSRARTFFVGGSDGWVTNPDDSYDYWARSNRFQVNDTLYFGYKKGEDSVLVVRRRDYFNCNNKNPIKKMEDGNSEFKFDRSGAFYFITGNKQHCKKGQKLRVIVLEATIKPPPPPPPFAQPPTTVPHPSPVPSANTPAFSPIPSPVSQPPTSAKAPSPATKPPSPTSPPPKAPAPSHKSPAFAPSPTYISPVPSSVSPVPEGSPTLEPSPPSSFPVNNPPAESPKSGTPSGLTSPSPAPAPAKSSSFVATPSNVMVLTITVVICTVIFGLA